MRRIRLSPDERKRQIQKVAMELFTLKGFKDTTMQNIVEKSGLSTGGLYHHYSSTNEILYDIMTNGNIYRENLIAEKIKEYEGRITDELMAKMIVDKMLADNEFIPIYVIFLQAIEEDDNLKDLYEELKIKATSKLRRIFLDKNYEFPTGEKLDLITDLINSSLLSCEILKTRENFIKNRKFFENLILSIIKE
ncbi:MAG: TetR/AcrR family transcriptional regulator [Epulopiscium sp.]|nr:TetR/AcrR family transcriptional regulator [Candidatus Epulonipiscium sp.]